MPDAFVGSGEISFIFQLMSISNDTKDDGEENIQLSDVIEVIETDPDFIESNVLSPNPNMLNGGTMEISPALHQSTSQASPLAAKKQARIRIVEQPASKALRFRYECEGRSAGSIPGSRSTPENKSYPSIRVEGYQGRAVVVVSCVTRDAPYKPHPYKLVSKAKNTECKNGILERILVIKGPETQISLKGIGVQRIKLNAMAKSLEEREFLEIDPFSTGFSHRNQPTSIDLNVVRLCFQVFLEGDTPGKFSVPLQAVVSEPIYDKKAMSDLTIIKLSDCVSYVDGGRKDIILLCEKVAKEDIQVRFFEENSDWEAFADIQPAQVHKQHAIWFKTPRYKTIDVRDPVKVFIQLRRPSDGATSEAHQFELWPPERKRKRPKYQNSEQFVSEMQDISGPSQQQYGTQNYNMDPIKVEPRTTPSPYGGSLSPFNHYEVNPGYQMNILSPQTQPAWNSPVAGQALPSMGMWNINTNEISNLNQIDVQNLDSGEIVRQFTTIDSQNSLPNLDISLSDIVPTTTDNMTDSISKLVNMKIDEIGPF
ncbi:unnamed protein product [Psylliodes chrysocephalus]|uniref:RHD domain-containing protein n=1 Tax=Psylliodes chrysocephalus TaxID=3402493 RepID=A0A9P0CCG8_9CUCU|nr:unnamed protein product [Psylliodes chrysocephala]